MFTRFGITEIVIIAVLLLILFGGKKLPEFGRGIGEAIKEFKDSLSGKEGKSK